MIATTGKIAGLAAVLAVAALTAEAGSARDAIVAAVTDNPHRSTEARVRDIYRHPVETLSFFGIEPTMTVVEPLPGSGWYSAILGPLLKEAGTYIAAHYPPDFYDNARRRAAQRRWADTYVADRAKFGSRAAARFLLHRERIAPLESVDAVLLFRQMHNLAAAGIDRVVLKEFFDSLKPGGVLGIVQHREDEASPNRPAQNRGYLKESYVIAVAEAVGFDLAARSEINANPQDSKDYEIGVWALPPTLADRAGDRRKYLAIGESDRMTLKFVKPAN